MHIRLGTALTALMLLAVSSTALVVHYSWMRTASRNIAAIVGTLHERTAASVSDELESTFRSAEGAVEVIRSILYQGAVKPDDEAKREFVFLSVLRSQPAISWVGLGFPDGRFFGAHLLDDGDLEMVEIGGFVDESMRALRRDLYTPLPGDIHFNQRLKSTSAYVTAGARWYRKARTEDGVVWSEVDILPSGFEPAAVVSKRLTINGRFEGVIMVSLNASRIAGFLESLDIAAAGATHIIAKDGTLLATSRERLGPALQQGLAQARRLTGSREAIVDIGDSGEHFITATDLGFNDWRLLTVVPRSAFTGEIDRSTRQLLFVVIALAALGAMTSALFAHIFFARPIHLLARELRHIENFALAEVRHIGTRLVELDRLSSALKRMSTSLEAFGLFVPTEIVRTLVARGVAPRPGGEIRDITVMFADLPGFTQLTEKHGAGVAPFLTEFLTLATEAIHREGGTVDKFIGDAIMAIWNAPENVDSHAAKACRAAIRIRDLMRDVARPDGRTEAPLVRIGMSTGPAFVGNIGSSKRLSYTAIGDVVNIASRLEAMCKELGTEIAVSSRTALAAGTGFRFVPCGSRSIRGRQGALEVLELRGTTFEHSLAAPAAALPGGEEFSDAAA